MARALLGGLGANGSVVVAGNSTTTNIRIYTGLDAPERLATASTTTFGDLFTGDRGLGIQTLASGVGRVFVPKNYVSGDVLAATTTWLNHSFESLNVQTGTYRWEWNHGYIEVAIGGSVISVPLPGSLALYGLVLVFLTLRAGTGVNRRG